MTKIEIYKKQAKEIQDRLSFNPAYPSGSVQANRLVTELQRLKNLIYKLEKEGQSDA
jgi:hypothetical protein